MSLTVFDRKESVAHFEALFEHATTGIIIIDDNGKIIAANPFALLEFGYSKRQLSGRPFDLLIPARFRSKYLRYYRRYFCKSPEPDLRFHRELFALKKDGAEIPVEITLSVYRYDDSTFGLIFIDDISTRRKAEERIRRLNAGLEATVVKRTEELAHTIVQLEEKIRQINEADALLQETNQYLNSILNHAGAMITAVDVKGVIRLFNPNIERALGYRAEEMIGIQSPLLFCDPELVKERKRQLFAEFGCVSHSDFDVFTMRARLNISDTGEWIYVKKDGSRLPVSLTVTALRNENDDITGYMGIAFDISERKKAEQDLRISLEREKDLNELKSRFISMASHEFRTPLSTILSSAYLIGKYAAGDDQPRREVHLQRIVSSVTMLTDTLNDFLSVGKIEEGKIQARLSPFDIREAVLSVVREMENNLRKGQQVRYRHDGGDIINLDSSLLKHILMNLLSNASKFSPEGGQIEVHTAVTPIGFRLSVKDNGIGIPEEDKVHLMERFFRGSNAANIQGTGLGLHIVAKYAEMMNGVVEWRSELQKGSEFTVAFTSKNI